MSTNNLLQDDSITTFGSVVADAIPRDTVVAVIYAPVSHTFLCQFWEEYKGLTCLLSGGIESGEDKYDALKREISEETGYTDFEIQGVLGGEIKSYYTKHSTGEKLVKHITPFLVTLNSLSHDETAKEEDENFENIFLPSQDVIDMMERYEQRSGSTLADHKEILNRAVSFLQL